MNKYVKYILDEYEYPIINSLLYANGDILVLRSYFIEDKYKMRILCKSTINSYFDYNDKNIVSSFSVPVCVENKYYSIYAGEGSWGSDGIVFVIDKVKNEPVWFLFLDNSNPFEEVIFETSDIISVRSSLDVKLRIPIKEPSKIKVIL